MEDFVQCKGTVQFKLYRNILSAKRCRIYSHPNLLVKINYKVFGEAELPAIKLLKYSDLADERSFCTHIAQCDHQPTVESGTTNVPIDFFDVYYFGQPLKWQNSSPVACALQPSLFLKDFAYQAAHLKQNETEESAVGTGDNKLSFSSLSKSISCKGQILKILYFGGGLNWK